MKKILKILLMMILFSGIFMPNFIFSDDGGDSGDSSESNDSSTTSESSTETSDDDIFSYDDYIGEGWYQSAVDGHWSQEYCESLRLGENYASRYSAALQALENAKAAGERQEVIDILQANFDLAKNACEVFARDMGGTTFEVQGSIITVYDNNHNAVFTTGDPIIIASGETFIQDYDGQISYSNANFRIMRRYSFGTGGGVFGKNWNSNLDSRILRGEYFAPAESLKAFKEYFEIVKSEKEFIESNNESDSDYYYALDEISQMYETAYSKMEGIFSKLMRTGLTREEVEELFEEPEMKEEEEFYDEEDDEEYEYIEEKIPDEKKPTLEEVLALANEKIKDLNKFVTYGFAGELAKDLDEDFIIFCDDIGCTILLKKNEDGNFVPELDLYKGKIWISEDENGFSVNYKTGEIRRYNAYGLPEKYSLPGGSEIIFTYDDNYVLKNISADGKRFLECAWDGKKLISTFDGIRKMTYHYENDFLSSLTDWEGDTKSFTYNEDGRISRQIKADGSFVSFTYEEIAGKIRTVATTNELGATEHFDYDTENNHVIYTDHDGVQSEYWYDEKGRTVHEKYADGREIFYEYDEIGNIASRTDNFGTATNFYDEERNLIQRNYPDGSTEKFSYSNGNLISKKHRDGYVTTFSYDSKGNITGCFRNGKVLGLFEYDHNGFMTGVTNSIGNKTCFEYDENGNISSIKRGNSLETYVFDEIGRLIEHKDPLGNVKKYSYWPHKTQIVSSLGVEIEMVYSNRKLLLSRQIKDTKTGETRKFDFEYDKAKNCTGYYISGVDSKGRIVPRSKLISYSYSSGNRQVSVTMKNPFNSESDIEGWKSDFSWGQDGLVNSVVEGLVSNGNFVKSKETRFSSIITDSGTEMKEYFWDGIEKSYIYDRNEMLVRESLNSKTISTNDFSPDGRFLRAKSDFCGDMEFLYDETGLLKSNRNIGGVQKNFGSVERNADGILISATNSRGVKTTYSYDDSGNMVLVKNPFFSRHSTYDAIGRITECKVLDAKGKVVSQAAWTYSSDGRKISAIYGNKYKSQIEMNGFGDVISNIDGAGNKTEYFYDILGRLVESADPYGSRTRLEYNGLNQVEKVIFPSGYFIRYFYDSSANCVGAEDSDGKIWEAEYDSQGRKISFAQRPFFNKEYYEYDEAGRVLKIFRDSASGRKISTSYAYGSKGSSVSRFDSKSNGITSLLDGFGNRLSLKNRLGDMSSYSYNPDGSVKSDVDFNGQKTEFFYSEDGFEKTLRFYDGTFASVRTDCAGNIVSAKNDSESIVFSYDEAGKLVYQYDEKNAIGVRFSYDARGLLVSIKSSGLGTERDITYSYGKNGEIVGIEDKINNGDAKRVSNIRFVYDEMGMETLRIWSTGESVRTVYDKSEKPVLRAGFDAFSSLIFVEGTVYNENGARILSFDSTFQLTRYTYDENGRLESVLYPYSKNNFEYMKNLAVKSGLRFNDSDVKYDTVEISSDEYEKLQLLCGNINRSSQIHQKNSALKETFVYDSEGNMIQRKTPFGTISATFDSENRMISWGSGSFSYDKNGNLLSEKNPYGEKHFSYNAMNRMKSARICNYIEEKITEAAFSYDAIGRRTVSSSSDFGGKRTVYIGVSGMELISMKVASEIEIRSDKLDSASENANFRYLRPSEESGSARAIRSNSKGKSSASSGAVWGNAPIYGNDLSPIFDTQIGSDSSGYKSSVLMLDSFGTVKASVGEDGLSENYGYDAFGSPVSESPSAYGFIGKRYDSSMEMYDFGFRDYSSDFGRFSTQDPICDGNNWYSYCDGNPVNYLDPNGLVIVTPSAQYMNDDMWAGNLVGNSTDADDSMKNVGCAVTSMAEILNTLLAADVTPKDINDCKKYFEKGTANIIWNNVANDYGLTRTSIDNDKIQSLLEQSLANEQAMYGRTYSTRSDIIEDIFRTYQDKSEEYVLVARVVYHSYKKDGVDKEGLHFVTLTGETFEQDGKTYAYIVPTSKNDFNVGAGTWRGGANWIEMPDGRIAVPLDNIRRIDAWTQLTNKIGNKFKELIENAKAASNMRAANRYTSKAQKAVEKQAKEQAKNIDYSGKHN